MSLRLGLATALALAALSAPGLAVDASAAGEAGAPVVTSVGTVSVPAGGLTALIPIRCGVEVSFSDDTPIAAEGYSASIVSADGAEVAAADGAVESEGGFTAVLPCGGLVDGSDYRVSVTEQGGDQSEPADYTYEVVGHPGGITATSDVVRGTDGWTPGKPVTVSFRNGGAWEEGTTFSTQVWVSRTSEFTSADYTRNTLGGDAVVQSHGKDAPVLRFTPPVTAEGQRLWYSLVGHKDGKADYRFSFSAVPVHSLPAQPRAWVRSFGAPRGTARVGEAVGVSRPVLSEAGRAQRLTVAYQWFDGGSVAISGATSRTVRLTDAWKGRDLSLRVQVLDDDRAPRTKIFRFGRVG